jgi:glycosyltransferase involved in cell wall biosynthesis
MNKQTLVFQGPVFSRSGYGDHVRDLLKALKAMDRYDIKIVSMRWGNTPLNQTNTDTEFGKWMLERIVTQINQKPDVFMQVSVANEFQPIGHYNIGVTAGVETTIVPKDFIDGVNRMDLTLVPSKFTKDVLVGTVYQQKDKNTNQVVGEFKVNKPVEVLFEGVDTEIFLNKDNGKGDILNDIKTDFNFLTVGHWLKGNLGQDRKDLGMVIKTFATVFQSLPKEKQPGLILKTSSAGFSIMDRENMRERIEEITKPFGDNCPPIYLVHGDLPENEMASLYHNSKVKAMVSFTKGEGYGRPLAEFAATGKPVIVSGWSGHLDFLPTENTVLLEGTLTNVDGSAADNFLLKEAQWFTVNYSKAAGLLWDVFNNYKTYSEKSKGLSNNIINNFTLNKMVEVFDELMKKYVKEQPKIVPIKLPKLEKIK